MTSDTIAKIIEVLEKRLFTEKKPGLYQLGNVAVDLATGKPEVGVFINNILTTEGHGNLKADALQQELMNIWEMNGGGEIQKETPKPELKDADKIRNDVAKLAQKIHDEKEINAPPKPPNPKEPEAKAIPASVVKPTEIPADILNIIKSFVGDDVLEIFGDSGTCKSKIALELARQAIAQGKTVFYLDTERNLTEADIISLKRGHYKYTPIINEIDKISQGLPKVDLVIIDSIGFPVLTAYARMSMKQKGDALLKLIAIFGSLKEWAYLNKGLAVVINQPESDFNKEPGHLIRPFGDKSQFAAKEIWKTEIVQRGKTTKATIMAFRSRSLGHGTKIADVEISDSGVKISGA